MQLKIKLNGKMIIEGLGRVAETQFEGMKLKAEIYNAKGMFKMVGRWGTWVAHLVKTSNLG